MGPQADGFSWPHGARAAVSLSFDDARLSQVDVGLEILDAHAVRASFYVSPINLRQRTANWRRAAATGHEIGNHTMSHPCSGNFPWSRNNALEDYTLARMEEELLQANAWILSEVGITPQTFAYPCGQTFVGRGEHLESYVPLISKHFAAGRAFQAEVPNDPAFCDLSHLGAFDVDGQSGKWLINWIQDTCRTGSWVIFCGHEIGKGGRQTTLVKELDAVCRWLSERPNEIWTAPINSVAGWIKQARPRL